MSSWIHVVGGVLGDRRLRRLVLAFFGFSAAEYGVWVALLVYGYGLGGASAAGLVAVVELVPAALAAPLGAYAGDRFPRGRVLVAAYAIQALTTFAAAAVLALGAPPIVVLAAAGASSGALTFTRPTHFAFLPDVTPSAEVLSGANAVSGLAEGAGMLVGPLIVGILLTVSGPAIAFAAFAGILGLSALLVTGQDVGVEQAPGARIAARYVLGEIGRGFSALRAEAGVRLPIAVLFAAQVVAGALDVLFVAAAVDLLHAGAGWAGYLSAAFGLGAMVGATAAVSLAGRRRLTPALGSGALVLGGPVALLGLVPVLATAPLLVGLSGAGRSLASVSGNTLLQRSAPRSALARVFGVLESLTMVALGLGSAAASVLVAAAGIGPALIATGAFVPLVTVLLWRPLRALERMAPAPDSELLALARSLPIFAPLPAPALERILGSFARLELPAGETFIREGDAGDRFYILADGDVDVFQGGRRVAVRHGVDILGEIALLRDIPRTATVATATPAVLYALDREPFLEAVTGHPQTRSQAEQAADLRLAGDG